MATKIIYVIEYKGTSPMWSPITDSGPWTGREYALEHALKLSNDSKHIQYRVTKYTSERGDYAGQ